MLFDVAYREGERERERERIFCITSKVRVIFV